MDFSDFKELEFPHTSDIVYILYFRRPDDNSEVPFYVGESSRHIGRFGDYISAKFSAPTDYKIGEAIKYIRSFGFYIGIKYKETNSRKKEEKEILQNLHKKYLLLNYLPGFNYTKSDRAKEKIKIHEFVRKLIIKTNDHKYAKEISKNNKSVIRESKLPADYCDNARTDRIIKGSITSPSIHKDDNQYRCELLISKNSSDMLPHEYRKKKNINMMIGNVLYEAGVHETKKGVVWISSVLHTKGRRREKVRLVDALADIGLKNGDKIRITLNSEGSFVLQAQ